VCIASSTKMLFEQQLTDRAVPLADPATRKRIRLLQLNRIIKLYKNI